MRRILLLSLLALACASPQKKAESAAPAAAGSAPAAGRRLMVVGINDTHGALLSVPPPKWISGSTKSDIGEPTHFARARGCPRRAATPT